MHPLVIAFTGLATAGKSTAANIVIQHYPGHVRLSFADPLRQMLVALGLSSEELARKTEPCAILCGKTPRQALQTLGTEWGRNMIGQELWANAMRARIGTAIGAGLRVVIDDCRFLNEARLVHDMGGRVIALTRPGLTQMSHASEAGIPASNIDATISADSVEDLQAQLLALLNDWASQ